MNWRYPGLLLLRGQIQIGGEEKRPRQKFRHMLRQMGVPLPGDQSLAQDDVIGTILHHRQRQLRIIMINPGHPARYQLPFNFQGLRFDARPIQGERPGLPHYPGIGKRLFHDKTSFGGCIQHAKNQVQIAVADLPAEQLGIGEKETGKPAADVLYRFLLCQRMVYGWHGATPFLWGLKRFQF